MNSATERERYQRLKSHFDRCADLPSAERDQYVARLKSESFELAAELDVLLQHHLQTV